MKIAYTLLAVSTLARTVASQRQTRPTCTSTAQSLRAATAIDLPVQIRSNHFVITVCHGDRPLTFVLDTGAGTSIIDMSLAKEFGLEALSTFTSRGAGNGGSASAVIRRDSVRIAGTDIVVPFQQAIDFTDLNARGRLPLNGILGADFIERFVLGLDYRDSVMRVYDRKTFAYSGHGTAVPFTMSGRFIFVNGELGLADGATIPGRFVVDVGAPSTLALAKPFVDANHLHDRVGPTVRREMGRGVVGSSRVDLQACKLEYSIVSPK